MSRDLQSPVQRVLRNEFPERFVYAPNYWQWFAHHQNHDMLPPEVRHCESQLDLIRYLGLDVFSRNIYSRQDEYWFGGICDEELKAGKIRNLHAAKGRDRFATRTYLLKGGSLQEELQYVFGESTVVQKKFLIEDYAKQMSLLEELVHARTWTYQPEKYRDIQEKAGPDGEVIVGDFFSPLKMLHLVMGPIQTVYFLMDQPEFAKELLAVHEEAQLDLVRQAMAGGARVIMAMDNLDTMFHPPQYVEDYSASFYERASAICHEHGGRFFIHACGNQRENLALISSLGVDGLEGVAYPPLGNVELLEAFEMTSDRFIITGGISATETSRLNTAAEVRAYLKKLFTDLKPYKNRFVLAASCNTAINTSWSTLLHFRDAWLEFRDL